MKKLAGKYAPRIIGLFFILAGVAKVVNPNTAISGLESLQIPYYLANVTIFATTIIELYLGAILVLHRDLKWGLIASTGTVFLFTVYLWYISRFARPPSCGCLGLTQVFSTTKQEAVFGLARNVLLLWLLKEGYDVYVKPASGRMQSGDE